MDGSPRRDGPIRLATSTPSPVPVDKRPSFDISAPATGIVERQGVSLFGQGGVLASADGKLPIQAPLPVVKPRSLGEQLAMAEKGGASTLRAPAPASSSPFHARPAPAIDPLGDGAIFLPNEGGGAGEGRAVGRLTPLRPKGKGGKGGSKGAGGRRAVLQSGP